MRRDAGGEGQLAGLGAALLLPASLAIIRVVWPDAVERARVLGIWTGCNGLALAIGPTLGGAVLENLGWRGIFLAVVPFSVAALCLAVPSIPESADPDYRHADAGAQILGALALGGAVQLACAAIAWLTARQGQPRPSERHGPLLRERSRAPDAATPSAHSRGR